jgi:triosephosphate isomerase (TIM)
MRRKLVAGNWKMNGNRAALAELDAIAAAAGRCSRVDVAICPPFTLIEPAVRRGLPGLMIGAQDCHHDRDGPHTGCISAAQLKEVGARLVITGHSERRAGQCERDVDIRHKAKAAIAEGLLAITCVGETGAERQAGDAEMVVAGQIWGSVTKHGTAETLVVSYEPIWAIGTGRTPATAQVAAMHALIRETLCRKLGPDIGWGVRILYGGSVNAGNAAELLAIDNVDGALVGGASLKAADFCPIIAAAGQA